MAASEHRVKQAVASDLPRSVAIGLDETFSAIEECLAGLTDQQLRAEPVEGKHCIASLLLHTLENLDRYACRYQTGRSAAGFDQRLTRWFYTGPDDRPGRLPDGAALREILRAVAGAAQAGIDGAEAGDLLGGRRCDADWTDQGRNALDAYMRTIWHAMSHIRQVWALRALLGAVDPGHWPRQHWA